TASLLPPRSGSAGAPVPTPHTEATTPTDAATLHATPHSPAARDLVTAVMSQPPPHLARLAPLVAVACAEGDPVAEAVADRAAAHLAATLSVVRGPAESTPIVVAGSILTHPTPVASRVRAVLRARWPEAEVAAGVDGAAAAVWLALERSGRPPEPRVRERLFSIPTAS
ncbi:MAG: hypothetical protein HOV83_03880, partial [Catenulispora sp.]|nr:hypothetical protein [Catenulispora sp.]